MLKKLKKFFQMRLDRSIPSMPRPFMLEGRVVAAGIFETNRFCGCGKKLLESYGPEAPGSDESLIEWCPKCDGAARVIAHRLSVNSEIIWN